MGCKTRPPPRPRSLYVPLMPNNDMTIPDLAEWFHGVPRHNLVLVRTPDGVVRRMDHIQATYVYEKDGQLITTPAQHGTRFAMVIHVED
jgi:hypothetical protein